MLRIVRGMNRIFSRFDRVPMVGKTGRDRVLDVRGVPFFVQVLYDASRESF
jgi:hypothetical protein